MGFAVELYFDPQTEARVRGLWQTLASQGVNSYQIDVGARPHISLAVFTDLDPERLRADMEDFGRVTPRLSVELASVGSFATAEGVVYIAPAATPLLLETHRHYHARLTALQVQPIDYYLPGRWKPHCTVGTHLPSDKMADALRICRESCIFGPARFEEIGLIQFQGPTARTEFLYTFPLQDNGSRSQARSHV